MFTGDPDVHTIKVDYLSSHESPQLREAIDSLIEKNFESEFFISATEADREAEIYRQQLLKGTPIRLSEKNYTVRPDKAEEESPDPFS